MDNIGEQIKRLLECFLNQNIAHRMDTDDGKIKIYGVGDNLVRIDIKINYKWD